MLNLKSRVERKKKCIKQVKRGLLRCNVLQSAHLDFCATDLIPDTFISFCFMMFTDVLMKDLHVCWSMSVKYSTVVGYLSKCCFSWNYIIVPRFNMPCNC